MFRKATALSSQASCIKLFQRCYAAPVTPPGRMQKTKSSGALGGDIRNEVIRRALFDAPLRKVPESTAEELEQDRVINMAWDLYTREKRDAHQKQLTIKYLRMVDASNELKALSPELFQATQTKKQSILFPHQLKIPTLTPGNTIWNYTSQTKSTADSNAALELKEQKKSAKK